ncbi:MAG: VWA domain-containing protein [Halobacteriovoraceae bacterium]|nr:VWA domain-containing protein [Halobacteriovoraceae bacterium]
MLNKQKITIIEANVPTVSTLDTIFLPGHAQSYKHYLYLIISHYEAKNNNVYFSPKKNQDRKAERLINIISKKYCSLCRELYLESQYLYPIIPENKFLEFNRNEIQTLDNNESYSQQKINKTIKTSGRPKQVNLEQDEENPVIHNFEKVKTLDDFSGGARELDGSNDFENEEDALEELNLSSIVRSDVKTETFIKSDAVIENALYVARKEINTESFREYPEWFYKEQRYRKNWCRVIEKSSETKAKEDIFNYDKVLARKIREEVLSIINKKQYKTKLKDGPEIDLDELLRYQIEKNIYRNDTPFVFMKKYPQERDFSILFLVDSSLSIDSYVQNQHILDLFKHILYILSDALVDIENHVAFYSFHSFTRNQCIVDKLKGFSENMQDLKKNTVSLRPKGYTRIGAAIRHASWILKQEQRRHQFLFILSDGKPTDFDKYEGEHGFQDIKKALDEFYSSYGYCHLFTFSKSPSKNLSRIFSQNNYSLFTDEKQFQRLLSNVFYSLFSNN